MKWLVLATLVLGPWPDQLLIYGFRDFSTAVDQAGTMPADVCFQKAADRTRDLYMYYGPRVGPEVDLVFCITPIK